MVFDPCAPTEKDSSALAMCGIFVRIEGDDKNPGSPDLPVATLGMAVTLAAGKGHVYACAQTFAENLVVTAGVSLHGGLDCLAGWSYSGPLAKPTVLEPVTGAPLVLKSGAEAVHVRSFQIVAPDGVAAGASSIAVIAAGSTGTIEDSTLRSGDAVSGMDAADQSQTMEPPAQNGAVGGNACAAPSAPGGISLANACDTSMGGKGGDGGLVGGGSGDPGTPGPGGVAGKGDPGGGWTCGANGGEGFGHPGADGVDGADGGGGLSLGQIGEDGYRGADGGNGDPGKPGLGGGGGGGRAPGAECGAGKGGAAGGSGGPGGCGGRGGGGGMAGGSSIGLVSAGSTILLKNVIITTGNGGRGGNGARGQPGALGGKGGPGGTGTRPGCAGGDGGGGGKGGIGGGGRGGHSIGVAHDGSFTIPKGTSITVGSAGPGGVAPSSGSPGGEGASGDQVQL